MTVFLTVLKIIGIILLILLGTVLFLLLVILFAPIHYTCDGKYDDENKPLVVVKANWICCIFRYYFELKGKNRDQWLKVLWFKVYPKEEKKKAEKPSPESTDKALERIEEKVSDEETSETEDDDRELSETAESDAASPEISEEVTAEVVEDTTPSDDTKAHSSDTAEKRSFFQKLEDTLNNFKFKFKEICDKINAGKLKAEDFVEKISDPRTAGAIVELLTELKKLLYHIRPRKFRLYLKYGFNDPSHTGELFGFYNSLYGLHNGIPDIVPDFEHRCLEGDCFVKGYIQLFFVLIALLRLYFSKDVKRLWGIIKEK